MSTALAEPIVVKTSRELPAPARSEFRTRAVNWTRLWAILRKEVIQIRRDSRSLAIVVAMPVVLMLLFGYGVSLDIQHVPLYVFDREGSQQSQDLLKRFQASDCFDIVRVVNNYPDLTRAIDDGHAKMGIVIPWEFSQRLQDGRCNLHGFHRAGHGGALQTRIRQQHHHIGVVMREPTMLGQLF